MRDSCRAYRRAGFRRVDEMEGTILKRLIRRPWLSLTGFLVGGALCLLLCLLTLHLDRQQAHLEEVRNSYEIRAVVSDVRGTKTDRLFMSYRYTDFLRDEQNGLGAYVRDLRLTKSFDMNAPFGTGKAVGVTNERCAAALDPKAGGAWYAETEDFFESSERICLVSEVYYEALAGQDVSLTLTDGYAIGEGKGEYPFKVVGWYKGEGTNVYLPYPTSQIIAGQLAEAPSTDSACFIVKDNERIDEMLAVAESMFRKVDPGEAQGRAFALTVHDRQYKATIASMEQNIRRIQEETGVSEFHFSAREPLRSQMQFSNPDVYMGAKGADEDTILRTTARRVSETIKQLRGERE